MKENRLQHESLRKIASSMFSFVDQMPEQPGRSEGLNEVHYSGNIFCNETWSQVLLCFTNCASFDEDQFRALKQASLHLDEQSLYYLSLEITSRGPYYQFERLDFSWDIYAAMDHFMAFQNILFSDSQKWGAMLFYEDYGILGGEKELIDRFKAAYPEWSQGKKHFTELWEEAHRHSGVDISWVPRFLASMD